MNQTITVTFTKEELSTAITALDKMENYAETMKRNADTQDRAMIYERMQERVCKALFKLDEAYDAWRRTAK